MSRSSILFSKLTNCNVLLLLLVFISSLSRAFLTIDVLYWAVGPLMLLIICKNLNQGFKDYSLRIILFFLIAFSLWCAISAFWSIAPFTTLARSVWFMVIAVGGVMMGWQSRNSERTWFSAGSFIAGIILIASILSLTLRIPGDNWSGGNAMGFKGCSVHQNTLGAVIITMLPFSIFELSRILKLPLSALFDRSETSTNGIEWNSLFVHGLIITGNIYVLFLTHSRGYL